MFLAISLFERNRCQIYKIISLISVYRKCQEDDFHCGSDGNTGRSHDMCIPKEKRCDGYTDCRNSKDEQGCGGNGVACPLDKYRCANGQRCIDTSLKCDYKNDCGDNSDEVGCSKYAQTPNYFFS